MTILRKLMQLTGSITGTHIERLISLPNGRILSVDVSRRLPNLKIESIFDVGANIGQSAVDFAEQFPAANIYSFEPIPVAFQKLCHATRRYSNICPYQVAVSSAPGIAYMIEGATLTLSRIVDNKQTAEEHGKCNEVLLKTIDQLSLELNVQHINYLKVDTEGSDLKVLDGAISMLENLKIDIVEVEAGTYPENELHVPLEILKNRMESYGYRLFGIYEQGEEWKPNHALLRRANLAFISPKVINESTAV